jgi:hypothetical protein
VFQRLQLIPGQHEVTLYLRGYRTHRESVYLNPGSSRDVRHTMATLAPGEVDDPAPVPLVPPFMGSMGPVGPMGPMGPAQPPAGPSSPLPPTVSRDGTYGVLALRMQPADGRVFIDSEEWRSSQPQDRLSLQLAAGRHQLRIEKAGFQTFSGDLEIKAGETSTLNVSLLAQ